MPNDTDFLKKRVAAAAAQPRNATETTTSVSVADSTNAFLEDVTADNSQRDAQLNASLRAGSARARLEKLRARAEAENAADQERLARVAQQKEQDAALAAGQKRQEALTDVTSRVSQAVSTATESTGVVADRVAALPTVGGIGLMVGILILLLFTVVRVNEQGDTRLKQLWYMLNGRATIRGRVQIQKQDPSSGNIILTPGGTLGGGSVGTFGGPDFTLARDTPDLGF